MSRPMPWPTRERMIERPSDSTCCWIAAETSPRWLPGRTCSAPAKRASRVTSSNLRASGFTGPTETVVAASATQPSLVTPTSSEMTSPRFSSYGPGMPWTTMEFGEAQIEPGKPRKPLNNPSAPWAAMNRSAASSSSAVVTPGWHLERSMWRQRAWMAPAAAIWSICSGVLRMITEFEGRALELFFHPLRGQHGPDAVADLIGRRRAVDAAKDAALLVVGHQRLGLVVIGAEPVSDYLGLVVVADF